MEKCVGQGLQEGREGPECAGYFSRNISNGNPYQNSHLGAY